MLKGSIVKGREKALGMRYPFNFIQLDRNGMHETLQASISCNIDCINISTWCSGSPKGMDFLTKL